MDGTILRVAGWLRAAAAAAAAAVVVSGRVPWPSNRAQAVGGSRRARSTDDRSG